MARKTATITIYRIFSTARDHVADVRYRGKLVRSYDGVVPQALCDKARAWAHANGFTHCNVALN
mgnify:CR=1 FL=1